MNIRVRYKGSLAEAARLNLYLSRNPALVSAAGGVLLIISGPAAYPDAAAFFYLVGAFFIVNIPVLVMLGLYRHRALVLQEAEVTLTSEGIERRSAALTLRVAWDMVERADELRHHWLFTTKSGLRRTALRKRELSQEQQEELAAFIDARHLNKKVRKGMTPAQEARYALDYGVDRSDLKPEIQAEYDRLAAERRPA